ncbi:PHD finger protein 24-like isoform X2 [Acanthaster planci]|uniref:PHD finger protein 24-like isoform X2 n=1 Tax=Acanthaster planci TaxID=133434 RepID=A0A8B7YV81_ACAPL|nr:PHD finger protein 24-like isoform X2 [Acanthaster planci]
MGVTLGKGKQDEKKAPIDNFRRAAKVVTIMRKTSRDASTRLADDRLQEPHSAPAIETVAEETELVRKESQALLEDLRNMSSKKETGSRQQKVVDDSRTLVFKDTTDAWAALREGFVDETTELPDTEFSLVESAISGYRTVERVRGTNEDDPSRGGEQEQQRGRSQSNQSDLNIPYTLPAESDQLSNDEKCAICRSHSGGILFPCRICTHVFHESCLQKSGRVQDSTARQLLRRANAGVGWSCHECEDLSKLLHQDDMFELMEVFETADIDSDASISLEEFMAFRRRVFKDRHDRDMLSHEEEDEINQFKAIDTDRTGSLSWWEFLSHEAVRRLSSQSKKSLAKKLSPKEVQTARENFRAFDTDGDGVITEFEARRAYRSWYSNFIPDPNEMTLRERRKIPEDIWLARSKELNTHVDANTNLLMSGDTDGSGTISWEEYLLEQALFIIAARPNVGPVKLNRRPSFAQ